MDLLTPHDFLTLWVSEARWGSVSLYFHNKAEYFVVGLVVIARIVKTYKNKSMQSYRVGDDYNLLSYSQSDDDRYFILQPSISTYPGSSKSSWMIFDILNMQ